MAHVYLVRHAQIGSLHALKVLAVNGADVQQRLLQEGRIQGQLRDPRVVTVTDVVDVHGAPGLIMEYIDGPSLAQLLERLPPSVEQVDHLARSVLGAMAAAHSRGLVHRDLKPANILLQVDSQGLHPKLADFGLAKVLGAGLSRIDVTITGAVLGTPRFMAPEQIRGAESVDVRADVFALGAILWEALFGEPAFAGDDLPSLFTAIDACESLDPRAREPVVPQRMARALRGALRHSPADRWPDAGAMLDAWTDGTLPPALQWSEQQAASIQSLAPSRPQASLPSSVGAPTWSTDAGPGFQYPENATVSYSPSGHAPAPGARTGDEFGGTRRLVAGVLLAATVAATLGALVWFSSRRVDQAEPSARPPVAEVSDDPANQARFERVWELIHRGERARAYALATQVADAEPDSAWARFAVFVAAPPDEAVGHLEAAARLATGASAEERLVRLCSQGMVGLSVAADWDAFAASSDLEYLPIARAQFAPGLEESYDRSGQRQLWELARDAVPESVLPWDALVELAIADRDYMGAATLLGEGQTRFPASPALLARQVRLELVQGRFSAARDAALEALKLDPSDRDTREGLATAHLHIGDWDAYRAEVDTLLSDGRAAERANSAANLSREPFSLGRMHETERLLDACRDIARQDDLPATLLYCELSAFGVYFLLDDLEGMARTADDLQKMSSDPGMPALMQTRVQHRLLLTRGIVEAKRGQLDEATADRNRLASLTRQAKDVDVDASLVWLDRALHEARQEKDPAFVEQEIGQQLGGACQVARHLEAAGAPHEAETLYRKIVAGQTEARQLGYGFFAEAFAGVRLAELTVQSDPDTARNALAYFDERWASADADHPLVERAEVVRASLDR